MLEKFSKFDLDSNSRTAFYRIIHRFEFAHCVIYETHLQHASFYYFTFSLRISDRKTGHITNFLVRVWFIERK